MKNLKILAGSVILAVASSAAVQAGESQPQGAAIVQRQGFQACCIF